MTRNEKLIKEFRSIVSESGIDVAPITDELLLCFLNFRNEDKIRALKALKNYIGFKKSNPRLMMNLKSTCPQLLANSVFHRLSPVRDQHGRFVYIVPMGFWRDDLCSVEDVVRVYIHDLHIVVSDSETQRRGAVGILDFKNVGIRKMKDVTPSLLKKLADIVQVAIALFSELKDLLI